MKFSLRNIGTICCAWLALLSWEVVQATSIMRMLQIGDCREELAPAVAELGRIDKTIHARTHIDDESKRWRTLNQLNRGERKPLKRVFHCPRLPTLVKK